LPRALAGRGWFPTLSPQAVHRRLDPYPAAISRCPYPFLPARHRPHVSLNTFGSRNYPCKATATGCGLRGCSHSVMCRLPCLLAPQVAPTAVACASGQAGTFTPRNEPEVTLRNCGIATCLHRAMDTAGLSPAGLWPCRPLHKSLHKQRISVFSGCVHVATQRPDVASASFCC
jgi:hypothetical protein